jgi:hypothetical protein
MSFITRSFSRLIEQPQATYVKALGRPDDSAPVSASRSDCYPYLIGCVRRGTGAVVDRLFAIARV